MSGSAGNSWWQARGRARGVEQRLQRAFELHLEAVALRALSVNEKPWSSAAHRAMCKPKAFPVRVDFVNSRRDEAIPASRPASPPRARIALLRPDRSGSVVSGDEGSP